MISKNLRWPLKIQDGHQNDLSLSLSFKCRASQTPTSLDMAIFKKNQTLAIGRVTMVNNNATLWPYLES